MSQTGPTSTHGAALALLHNPLAVRTVQLGTVRLLVGALHVAVRTFAGVAPLGTPDLAVGQHWGQVVQGSAGLCNVKELLRSLLQCREGRVWLSVTPCVVLWFGRIRTILLSIFLGVDFFDILVFF